MRPIWRFCGVSVSLSWAAISLATCQSSSLRSHAGFDRSRSWDSSCAIDPCRVYTVMSTVSVAHRSPAVSLRLFRLFRLFRLSPAFACRATCEDHPQGLCRRPPRWSEWAQGPEASRRGGGRRLLVETRSSTGALILHAVSSCPAPARPHPAVTMAGRLDTTRMQAKTSDKGFLLIATSRCDAGAASRRARRRSY